MGHNIRHLEPGRPARPGQLILERRRRLALSVLAQSAKPKRLLDIGCGNGAQTVMLADLAGKAFGLDFINLRNADGYAPGGSFCFIQGNALALPFAAGEFELVTAFEVLEHLPDDSAALSEMRRVLAPGGRLILSVPNKWWLFESHGARVPGLNWIPWNRVPFIGWLPASIHGSIAQARTYTMRRLAKAVTSAGFQVHQSGYITAPLDVLPDGVFRSALRNTIFRGELTPIPMLAVNLFLTAQRM